MVGATNPETIPGNIRISLVDEIMKFMSVKTIPVEVDILLVESPIMSHSIGIHGVNEYLRRARVTIHRLGDLL